MGNFASSDFQAFFHEMLKKSSSLILLSTHCLQQHYVQTQYLHLLLPAVWLGAFTPTIWQQRIYRLTGVQRMQAKAFLHLHRDAGLDYTHQLCVFEVLAKIGFM